MGGHCSSISSRELVRVKEERQQSVDAWVCPLQHHCTNRHGKGRKQEEEEEEEEADGRK